MRWFRAHGRAWSWVALLALALQLGLAFGHVHPTQAVRSTLIVAADSGTAPSHSNTGGQDDGDYCATCAILALLTGAQTPTAPVVAPPIQTASASVTIFLEAARIDACCAAFRSRAPPQA